MENKYSDKDLTDMMDVVSDCKLKEKELLKVFVDFARALDHIRRIDTQKFFAKDVFIKAGSSKEEAQKIIDEL